MKHNFYFERTKYIFSFVQNLCNTFINVTVIHIANMKHTKKF